MICHRNSNKIIICKIIHIPPTLLFSYPYNNNRGCNFVDKAKQIFFKRTSSELLAIKAFCKLSISIEA